MTVIKNRGAISSVGYCKLYTFMLLHSSVFFSYAVYVISVFCTFLSGNTEAAPRSLHCLNPDVIILAP